MRTVFRTSPQLRFMAFSKAKFTPPVFLRRNKSLLIGYVSYSSLSTNFFSLEALLRKSGCSLVFQDVMELNKKNSPRPKLEEALAIMGPGDELIVPKLHDLRNTQFGLIPFLLKLCEEGKFLRSLDGLVETKKLDHYSLPLLGLLSAIDEFESDFSRQTINKNINRRRENSSNLGGRPKTHKEKEYLVVRLRNEGFSYRSIRNQTGLALSTIRRIILDYQPIE